MIHAHTKASELLMIRSTRAICFILLIVVSIPLQAQITIFRDSYGTPSISARKLEDAAYGFGYATAMDNAERMARNYKMARGRTGEVEGKGTLLQDGFLRSLGI